MTSLDDQNQTREILTTINDQIPKIANQASLTVVANDNVVKIKHKFRIGDKSTFGVFIFLLGGIFFIIFPFIKTSDYFSKIVFPIAGLFLVILSVLTLIRQVSDGLEIKDSILTFRYNLKRTIIPLNRDMKIKMKSEIVEVKRAKTSPSYFIVITHFLHNQNKEFPILQFQMDKSNSDKAIKLGNEFSRVIKAKIRQ